mgnify:CR=1 FL=1
MQAAAEDCEKLRKDEKWGYLLSTQQSLSESMNIDDGG